MRIDDIRFEMRIKELHRHHETATDEEDMTDEIEKLCEKCCYFSKNSGYCSQLETTVYRMAECEYFEPDIPTHLELAVGAHGPAKPEPAPTGNGAEIWPVVMKDIIMRVEAGKEKYGTPLRANNGRDALWDAYQEALDLCMYLRQSIIERAADEKTKR